MVLTSLCWVGSCKPTLANEIWEGDFSRGFMGGSWLGLKKEKHKKQLTGSSWIVLYPIEMWWLDLSSHFGTLNGMIYIEDGKKEMRGKELDRDATMELNQATQELLNLRISYKKQRSSSLLKLFKLRVFCYLVPKTFQLVQSPPGAPGFWAADFPPIASSSVGATGNGPCPGHRAQWNPYRIEILVFWPPAPNVCGQTKWPCTCKNEGSSTGQTGLRWDPRKINNSS